MSDYRIKVGVELNTKDIDRKIKSYKAKPIEIGAKLNISDIDKKLSSYKAKKSVEVNAKLNTAGLAKKIGEYKPKTPIKLNAKLDTKNINAAISNYKAKKAIELNVKLNHSTISQQIKNYKAKNSITLNTKLDNSEITRQIKSYQAKAPINLKVKLTTKDIDEKIRTYKAKTPIKLDVKINKSVINEQIKSFNPKNTIKLKAALQKGVIAEEIRKFKPSTPIKVDLELDYSDIDKKVGGYITTKGAVELPVKLKPAKAGFSDSVTKNPIKVSATLESSDINKAIDNFNPTSKIKVDVKLNPKDINTQVKGLAKPTEPINVGIKLDESAINADIALFKPTATLGIQPDLILENVDDQIRAYVPKAPIKVNVQINDEIGEEAKKQNAQNPITVNVKLDPDGINKQIEDLNPSSKVKVGVQLDFASHKDKNTKEYIQKGISKQIKDYETKTKVKVGVQLDRDSIIQEIGQINVDTPIRLGVELDPNGIQNVENQINNLRQQIQNLGNVQINLGGGGNGTGNGGAGRAGGGNGGRRQVDEVTQAYRELMGVLRELDSKRLQLNRLTASSPQASNEIQTLRLQIEQLGNEYDNLLHSFNVQGIQFTAEQWNQLETVMARVGRQIDVVQAKMSDKSAIQSQTQAYQELIRISKEIGSLELNIEKLRLQGGSSNQIEILENQLRTLQSTYQQIVTTMETPLTNEQWGNIYTQIAKTSEELEKLRAKHADTRAELQKEIKTNIGTGKLQKEINDVRESFELLRIEDESVKPVQDSITRLQTLLGNMGESSDIESVTSDYQEFLQLLSTVKNKINELQREQSNSGEMLDLKKQSAMIELNSLFEQGSQAAKHFGSRAKELAKELNACGNANVDNVTRKIANLGKEVKKSGLQTKTLGSRLKEQLSKYSNYLSIASVFMYATQAARSMFEQVKLIDSAMTELKKVTNETDESYNRFLTNAASRSKELGTTIDGLVSSTADFARLGYSFEDAQGLAEVANIYAVVGDEIEGVEGATQSLVSTMAAFRGEMNGMNDSDFAMGIVDKMNEVSNNFAISSGGIGEALQRSASSMAAANNSLDETIALITAANEVAQNPEKVGRLMPT